MTGSRLGHYEILEKLGEGGMGVVFKARDTSLDRLAAIKILPPDRLRNADQKQRFIREAKAASALNHPNIVTIYEIGEQDGADYIAMEYVAGRTLEQLIVGGGMRLADVLRVAVPVADALARAHSANIVHRDVKPGNVMVGDDGQVKLLDFGLAKLTENPAEEDPNRTVRHLTEEGTVMGTVAYMSPEQAEGRKVDGRSDIFSFGTVLYEMATGQLPFRGNSVLAMMAAILQAEAQPPREIAAAVPAELERIIQRCLRKDPAWRFQSAADLKVSLAELERTPAASGPTAVIPPQPARRFPRWIAALAAGLLLGGSGAWWLVRRAADVAQAVYTVRPLTTYSGLEQEPALSPDGNQVAFAWNGEQQDNFDIYVRLVDGGSPLRLTRDTQRDRAPAWSPDGRLIAYLRGRALYVVPALGGNERLIVQLTEEEFNGNSICWSADGRHIAFSAAARGKDLLVYAARLKVVTVDSGEVRMLSDPPAALYGDFAPAFSPDGKQLAFVRRKDFASSAVLLQGVNADALPTGAPRELTGYSSSVEGVAWLPDSQSLVASVNPAAKTMLVRLRLDGQMQPLGIESGRATHPSLSRTGNRLAYEKKETNVNIWMVDGPGPEGGPQPYLKANPRVVVDSTVLDSEPMLSADGALLAFRSERNGTSEIYTAKADGSSQEAVTAMGPRTLGSGRWSPDGQHIAFDRYEEGRNLIYVVRAQGGKARRMIDRPSTHTRPSWSRDGKWIYFTSNFTGRNEIWKVQWNGMAAPGAPVQVTTTGGSENFESPDGSEILYTSPQGLNVMPASGGASKLLIAGVVSSAFALAGHSVYYLRSSPPAIWVYRRDSGRQFEYLRFPSADPRSVGGTAITVSPDERRIYFHQRDRDVSDLMLVENFR